MTQTARNKHIHTKF